jgi:pyridoxamine 5'-phosphate oxidase
MSVAHMRKTYEIGSLNESELEPNPIKQFQSWLDQALKTNIIEPTAFCLATSTSTGQPSARMVLLKGVSEEGFIFYSNYESRKGQELRNNPNAAMSFYWDELERQVRIEGKVSKLSREASESYFRSRPPGSQMGALASEQSKLIDSRETLEAKVKALEAKYGNDIPFPENWGGYLVTPRVIEFWQGRPSRLHDRLRYRLEEGNWIIERLQP